MQIIAHRRNTRALLAATPEHLGVEIDLRSWGDKIILQHDAFVPGEDFEEWLAGFRHRTLILNVKEEGLEDRLTELMTKSGIEDFFFLDQSFPFLMRSARKGESRCAVRVSEYESVTTALNLAGLVRWVWIDCFTRFPISKSEVSDLRAAGFNLCLVSPELQGRTNAGEIVALRDLLRQIGLEPDAVCTKTPDLWT